MNIALCYSGQIRNFQECYDTHIKYLIDSNPEDSFYIFGHLWHDSKKDLNFLKMPISSVVFESPISFQSSLVPDKRFPWPIHNTLSMFFSMQYSNDIKNTFSSIRNIDFDCVVRLRTDLYFYKSICFKDYNMDQCYVNKQFLHTEYAVNDLFAFSNPSNMDTYCSTFSNITELAQNGCAVNPECFLGFNLRKNNIPINQIPLEGNVFDLFRKRKI